MASWRAPFRCCERPRPLSFSPVQFLYAAHMSTLFLISSQTISTAGSYIIWCVTRQFQSARICFFLTSGIFGANVTYLFIGNDCCVHLLKVAMAFCLTVAWTSEHLGLSIELGAFFAGLTISLTPFAERTLHNIEPVRNVFAGLFLASIGIVMNPTFLWLHFDVLFATLFVVVFYKCSLIALVVRAFGYTAQTSLAVGISMAQVGEFSFVLLAHASNLGLVQRKLYFLLQGTTALSMIVSPCLLRCTHFF